MNARPVLLAAGLAGACLAGQAGAVAGAQAQPAQQAPRASRAAAATRAAGSDATLDALFKAWDTDHDGRLSPTEFNARMAAYRRRVEAGTELAVRLREQFDKVDADRNEAIDAGEYPSLLLVRQRGKAAPALAAFDRNGDQRLQFAEYVALVARLAPAQRTQP